MNKEYGMVIDLQRCIGCQSCAVACKSHHQLRADQDWCKVRTVETGTFPQVTVEFLPFQCNQCENPSCLAACPVSAIVRLKNGVVLIQTEKCIGCRRCVSACPYGAIVFDFEKHKAGKCDFCVQKLEAGEQPPCVTCCPTSCRMVGDLHDPESQVSQLNATRNYRVPEPQYGKRPHCFYLEK